MKAKLILFTLFLMAVSIGLAQTSGDYRTATGLTTGNWNSTSTWETYNGTSWVAASSTPTSGNGVITIRNGATVTITAAITNGIDQVVVEAGGALSINTGLAITLANGTGLDLSVSGTFTINGTLTMGGSGNKYSSLTVNSGGVFVVNGTWGTNASGASPNRTINTISSGGSLVYGTSGTTTGNGEIVLSAGASMTVTSASGVNGHFAASGTNRTFSPGADYIFDGTATGMVTGTYLPTTVNDLTFTNPNGITLSSNIDVNGTLSIEEGDITFGT